MTAGSADLTGLADDLQNAGASVEESVNYLIQTTAQQVKDLAQVMAPKKRGNLADSIGIQYFPGGAIIGPGVHYGVFQEFGTATRGEFPGPIYLIRPVRANTLAFQINGKWVFTKLVKHPGIPPHPYMRPALQQAVSPFGETLASMGVAQITKGPHSAL